MRLKVTTEEDAEQCLLYVTDNMLLISWNFLCQAQCLKFMELQMAGYGYVKPISLERSLRGITVLHGYHNKLRHNCSQRQGCCLQSCQGRVSSMSSASACPWMAPASVSCALLFCVSCSLENPQAPGRELTLIWHNHLVQLGPF